MEEGVDEDNMAYGYVEPLSKDGLPLSTIRPVNLGRQVDRSADVNRGEQGIMGRKIPEIRIFHLCQPVNSYFNSRWEEADMQPGIMCR